MFASTLYNVGIFIVSSFTGGALFSLIQDIDRIRENRVLTPMNKMTQLCNPGFYLGSACAFSFLLLT